MGAAEEEEGEEGEGWWGHCGGWGCCCAALLIRFSVVALLVSWRYSVVAMLCRCDARRYAAAGVVVKSIGSAFGEHVSVEERERRAREVWYVFVIGTQTGMHTA